MISREQVLEQALHIVPRFLNVAWGEIPSRRNFDDKVLLAKRRVPELIQEQSTEDLLLLLVDFLRLSGSTITGLSDASLGPQVRYHMSDAFGFQLNGCGMAFPLGFTGLIDFLHDSAPEADCYHVLVGDQGSNLPMANRVKVLEPIEITRMVVALGVNEMLDKADFFTELRGFTNHIYTILESELGLTDRFLLSIKAFSKGLKGSYHQ